MGGRDCAMCVTASSDDSGYGVRFFAGSFSDAYLQRVEWAPGYSVVIWRGRHVADATELSAQEGTAYWQEVLLASRAIQDHFRPAKLNLMLLGNSLPHLHTHVVPRYLDDPAPGHPLPFPADDAPLRSEVEVQRDVAALRGLCADVASSRQPDGGGLNGIDHVQLAIPLGGESSARVFYEGLLGLREVAKPEPLRERGGCWFVGPGIHLHLGVATDFRAATKGHPAFRVRELAVLRVRLIDAGVTVTDDDALPGVRRFYASDPFGNRLEFIEHSDAGFTER